MKGEKSPLQQVWCFDFSFPKTQGPSEGGKGKCLQLMETMLGNWCHQKIQGDTEGRYKAQGKPGEEKRGMDDLNQGQYLDSERSPRWQMRTLGF